MSAGVGAAFFLSSWLAASGQTPGMPGGNVGYNAAVAKLFADIPAFIANVETVLTNRADNSRLTIPMRMLKRQDQLRIEVDFVKIKGGGVSLQGLSAMQNIGMARVVTLVNQKDGGMTVLFPDLKASTRVGMSEVDLPDARVRVSKKEVGKDTIGGQRCVRQQVTLVSPDGKKVEATTWESPALGNFPVRMFFRQDDGTMVMNYTDVQLTAPGDDEFKVPADYRPFESISQLMQDAMTKAMKGAGGR